MRLLTCMVLLGLALFIRPARGQDGVDAPGSGEVSITCPSSFGVGGEVRPGELAGIRLVINDSAAKPREILLRATLPDSDGDRVMWERSMTTNPGTPQPLWMYIRIPSRFESTMGSLTVTAFAAVEEGAGSGALEGERGSFGAGRALGTVRLLRPTVTQYRTDAMMALVGNRTMGLRGYEGSGNQWLLAGHERTRLITGMNPESFPDRWMGLAQFSVIVWNEHSPSLLGSERASAVREWVQRGGHLVVVLPRVGQAWTDEANNPLFDIVPRVTVTRREGVDLTPYAALIERSKDVEMPRAEVLQTFKPVPGAQPSEASCVLAGPGEGAEREWIAARRIVGTGMVTLVGLDLGSRWMDTRSAPDPELFWHRILGRRGELISQKQANSNSTNIFPRQREPVTYDGSIPALIDKQGQAAAGVLLGFVVFILYWLVAGPGGYAALKRAGQARHGWVAFLAAAAVFTGIAWGGATLIRPARTEARHLTFIDHVYGQNIDHAHTWMSLLVPGYGEATLLAGEPIARERARFHNVIAPFEADGGDTTGFPDARGYRIESKQPDQTTIPTRATVKNLQVDWAGAPPWKMPRPVNAETPLRVVTDENGKWYVTGSLMHELPGPLTDVVVAVVLGQRDVSRLLAGALPKASMWSEVRIFALSGEWKPGAENSLDLAQRTPRGSLEADRKDSVDYLDRLLDAGADSGEGDRGGPRDSITRRLTALAFFPQIEPPDVRTQNAGRFDNPKAAQRKYSHGMDLGKWFTQPCIIIVGHLGAADGAPSPVPLYLVSGGTPRPLETSGRTVVRWVYPLPDRPPVIPKAEEDKPGDNPKEPG